MTGRGFFVEWVEDVDTGSSASLTARSGDLILAISRPALGGDNAAFSQAKEEASIEGEVSYTTTGLIVRGGVIGRSPAPCFLTLETAGLFLTGSVSSRFCSNRDTRALVGPIGLESVVRSKAETGLRAPSPATSPLRRSLTLW